MGQPSLQNEPTFLPAALSASNVGSWNYDIVQDRIYCDVASAALLGFSTQESTLGVPMERLDAAIHPADRARTLAKRDTLLHHGGLFAVEYRVVAHDRQPWVLVRGRYEKDGSGDVVRAVGIIVDITDAKQDVDGDAAVTRPVPDGHDAVGTPLDQAAEHAMAARRSIDTIHGPGRKRLRPTIDALLMALGRELAASIRRTA